MYSDQTQNKSTYRIFRPALDSATPADCPRGLSGGAAAYRLDRAARDLNAVLFLAPDEARYIAGTWLPVDAGA